VNGKAAPADGMVASLGHYLQAYAIAARAGNHDAALRAASDACHAMPHLPQPHYAYGEAWLALNQPGRAEQAFAAALGIAPGWADAWINYGIARYRQGSIDDAKTAMRQALGHAPANTPAHRAAAANLGAFLRITGEPEAAERLLHQILEREPGDVAARLNLVADLLQEERAADALDLLQQADPPVDDIRARRHWFLQSSLALLQLGRAPQARQVLDTLGGLGIPPAIAPLWHWRHVLLALCDGDGASARQAAARMEASLATMGAEAVLEHQIMGHYDLAKFWSGQGAHAQAFAHWQAGHALLARFQPFSRNDHLALIDANIRNLDRDFFKQAVRAGNVDATPVFVVGMPRSGTTLCERILGAHAQVHGAGERAALGQIYAQLCNGHDDTGSVERLMRLDGPTLDTAAETYLTELRQLAPGKRHIVDKMPGNYMYLGLVGRLFPGAKIIHCVRDPRDIGLSIFTFRFHGSHGYAHDLGDLGWTIAQHARLMAHWRAALPNPILTIRLADWVEDFEATLARTLAFLELPHDPNCARFYETQHRVRTVSRSQVRQPVNAGGLGRWVMYAQQLAPLIAELERAELIDKAASQ
jgi:tetratricopeptide (TPR) repeat protein